MTKKFLTFGILIVVLGVIFIPIKPVYAFWGINNVVGSLVEVITLFLMGFSSLILIITGSLFDWIIQFTIVDMARNIGSSSEVGKSISTAWATLRDVANMCFIFVLLFAAFKAMFDTHFSNFGSTVKNIIIVALLINFSLFFSKVVIDASNIVAIGFYNSITAKNETYLGDSTTVDQTTYLKGISAGYMKMLGVQTFFSSRFLDNEALTVEPSKLLVVGILSSIFMLIAAVILLISGIMFAARFIILIFLMILSPLALIAYIIPGQDGQFKKWKDALVDQSFFAPIFFALTWVVFKLGNSLLTTLKTTGSGQTSDMTSIFSDPKAAMAIVVNYVLIIGFSIAALVISKTMASKTAGFKQISGGIGAAAAGGTAWLGRTTIGQIGKRFSDNAALQKEAKEQTGWRGAGARFALSTVKGARDATFDVRNAAIPTGLIGSAIQGTVGRTGIGKKLGLNDVNIPSVALGSIVKDMDMLGKGGTKGYKETKEESAKRVHDREAAAASELTLAQAKKAVKDGASAPAGSPMIGEMEKALAKLSDKETEALVASNRELLKSQSFANAISVKQLEALNKSDQFSDGEKGLLKGARFKKINDAMIVGGAGAASVDKEIRNLSDSELEMIDPEHLRNSDFIAEMKSSQVEAVLKSSKFTTSQKDGLKDARKTPLQMALDNTMLGYAPNPRLVRDMITRKLSPKDVVGLMSTKVTFVNPTGATVTESILTHPEVMEQYTPKLLKRMAAADMNTQDIEEVRTAIENAGTAPGASTNMTKLAVWLSTPDGQEFS